MTHSSAANPLGVLPRIFRPPVNQIASRTDFDWSDIDAQLDELPDDLPDPVGWQVMALQFRPRAVTAGGLYKPDQLVDKEMAAMDMGIVLGLGPECYRNPKWFQFWMPTRYAKPWCQKYDVIGWDRYAGAARRIPTGHNLLFLADDQVKCAWTRPTPSDEPAKTDADLGDVSRASPTVTPVQFAPVEGTPRG